MVIPCLYSALATYYASTLDRSTLYTRLLSLTHSLSPHVSLSPRYTVSRSLRLSSVYVGARALALAPRAGPGGLPAALRSVRAVRCVMNTPRSQLGPSPLKAQGLTEKPDERPGISLSQALAATLNLPRAPNLSIHGHACLSINAYHTLHCATTPVAPDSGQSLLALFLYEQS